MKDSLSLVNFPDGRMNVFEGINSSTIIDDSYNASPEAYREALSLIYGFNSARRIIVIGNMNEFGAHSAKDHKNLAKLVKPNDQDSIVTIGEDANSYLFPELEKLGVKNLFKFSDPWSVGNFLKNQIKPEDLIFLKGSFRLIIFDVFSDNMALGNLNVSPCALLNLCAMTLLNSTCCT